MAFRQSLEEHIQKALALDEVLLVLFNVVKGSRREDQIVNFFMDFVDCKLFAGPPGVMGNPLHP